MDVLYMVQNMMQNSWIALLCVYILIMDFMYIKEKKEETKEITKWLLLLF